jgi:phosphoribosylaminoimidazole carboxylase (NCAIR synthetase)
MRYFPFLLLLFYSCNNAGSINYPNNLKTYSELSALFSSGQHRATLVTHKQLTFEQQKVLKECLNILASDETLQARLENLSHDEELANSKQIMKKFGLNVREAALLQSIFDKKDTLSESGTVLISKDENQITFKGSGRFSILDSLMINANDSTATFKQSKLKFHPT